MSAAWIAASVAVVTLAGVGLGGGSPLGWGLALVVYVLSGALALLDPVETLIGRAVFWLREPDAAELRRFESGWKAASTPSGVAAGDVRWWVRRGPALRGPATPGRFVAIPAWAANLTGRQLSAVISAEVARSVTGASRLEFLAYWYQLPARAAMRGFYWLTFGAWWWEQELSARRVGRTQSFWEGAMIAVAVLLNLWVVLTLYGHPVLIPLLALPPVQLYLRRRSVFAADRIASAGGHRDPLVAALRASGAEPGSDRRALPLLREIPAADARIERLRAG